MKKIVSILLILACAHNAFTMNQSDGEQPSEEGWNISSYLPDVSALAGLLPSRDALSDFLPNADTFARPARCFTESMNHLDDVFGAGAAQRLAHQNAMEPHAQIVREALAQGTLEQAICRASKEKSPERFVSLLIGMRYLKIQPDEDTLSIIQQRLNALKLKTREQTHALLAQRLTEERNLHELRKKFVPKQQMSDDEDYSTLNKFADTIVNDEKE